MNYKYDIKYLIITTPSSSSPNLAPILSSPSFLPLFSQMSRPNSHSQGDCSPCRRLSTPEKDLGKWIYTPLQHKHPLGNHIIVECYSEKLKDLSRHYLTSPRSCKADNKMNNNIFSEVNRVCDGLGLFPELMTQY